MHRASRRYPAKADFAAGTTALTGTRRSRRRSCRRRPAPSRFPPVDVQLFRSREARVRDGAHRASAARRRGLARGGAADPGLAASVREPGMLPNRVDPGEPHAELMPLVAIARRLGSASPRLARRRDPRDAGAWSRRSHRIASVLASRRVDREVARGDARRCTARPTKKIRSRSSARRALALQTRLGFGVAHAPEAITAHDVAARLGDRGDTIREVFEHADGMAYGAPTAEPLGCWDNARPRASSLTWRSHHDPPSRHRSAVPHRHRPADAFVAGNAAAAARRSMQPPLPRSSARSPSAAGRRTRCSTSATRTRARATARPRDPRVRARSACSRRATRRSRRTSRTRAQAAGIAQPLTSRTARAAGALSSDEWTWIALAAVLLAAAAMSARLVAEPARRTGSIAGFGAAVAVLAFGAALIVAPARSTAVVLHADTGAARTGRRLPRRPSPQPRARRPASSNSARTTSTSATATALVGCRRGVERRAGARARNESVGCRAVIDSMRLALVEDDERIGAFVQKGLAQDGHVVDWAHTGDDGLAAPDLTHVRRRDRRRHAARARPGIEVDARGATRKVTTPIIVLSARDSVDDRIAGLDAGADDYLTKPFSFAELVARLHALSSPRDHARQPTFELAYGGVSLDLRTRKVDARRHRRSSCRPRSSRCSSTSCATPSACSARR